MDGGACNRGDECGPTGNCVPLWSHHKCECGGDGGSVIVAPDCGASFVPFSLTEEQEIHFFPTDKYRRCINITMVLRTLFFNETSDQMMEFLKN